MLDHARPGDNLLYARTVALNESKFTENQSSYLVYSSGDATLAKCEFRNNNATAAIYAGGGTVTDSIISDNSGDGISMRSPSFTALRNVITTNKGDGIQYDTQTYDLSALAVSIRGNLIRGNGTGLRLRSSLPRIELTDFQENDIFGNNQYEVANETAGAFLLSGTNYWGDPTLLELHDGVLNLTKVLDGKDEQRRGQIVIRGSNPAPMTTLTLPPSGLIYGDLNGNGTVNLGDVTLILRRAVGTIPKFPVEP